MQTRLTYSVYNKIYKTYNSILTYRYVQVIIRLFLSCTVGVLHRTKVNKIIFQNWATLNIFTFVDQFLLRVLSNNWYSHAQNETLYLLESLFGQNI
jgi:hypothetical protein